MTRLTTFLIGLALAVGLAASAATVSSSGVRQSSGTFVASFDDACTTTPTITFDWVKVGSLVTLWAVANSGFPCTSDSGGFVATGTPLPAAIRPTTNFGHATLFTNVTNNGTSEYGCFFLNFSGNIGLGRAGSASAACNINAWTASGNKSAGLGSALDDVFVTYPTINP